MTGHEIFNIPSHHAIWGKTDRSRLSRGNGRPAWNPLTAHILDTAACAGQLWDRYLTPGMRMRLAEAFGSGDDETARTTVMFLAGLHDLGKGSGCFLRTFGTGAHDDPGLRGPELAAWRTLADEVRLPCDDHPNGQVDARHELITAAHLPRLLGCSCRSCGGSGDEVSGLHSVALLLGGHHGHIPDRDTVDRASGAAPIEKWEPVYRALIGEVADLLGVTLSDLPKHVRPERPSVLPMFAGLVILSDWIASSDDHFTYRRLGEPSACWWSQSQRQAEAAITELALDRWLPQTRAWHELFPDTQPRPFQDAALAALPGEGPAMVIIESDTGSGKTRLAFAIAHHLARTCGYQGLFMAMPTRAATNQVASELAKFIERSTCNSTTSNLAVVHAAAGASDLVHRLIDASTTPHQSALRSLPDSVAAATADSAETGRVALNPWYLRRCLGLISTFGIGTIDQVVLVPQPAQHWMLRFFGLAGKTVIIDEAHAYELFQQEMLSAAVEWLADAGASVIVLSATLPTSVRQTLVNAWCTGHQVTAKDTGQTGPIALIDQHGTVRRTGTPGGQEPRARTDVRLQPLPGPKALSTQLLREASGGGVIAVICNRVKFAIELHRTLIAQGDEHGWHEAEIVLLHGRLMSRDRLPIEIQLVGDLGPGPDRDLPNPSRPRRLLVVATQIVEQSLDIDFDAVYTNLAPIDLLIQRRGRLHRHSLNRRPEWGREPTLTVLWQPDAARLPIVEPPDEAVGRLQGNHDSSVYAPYTLAASWHALARRTDESGRAVIGADEHSALIHEVYGPTTPQPGLLGQMLARTGAAWEAGLTDVQSEAAPRPFRAFGRRGRNRVTALSLTSGAAHGGGKHEGAPGIAAVSRLGEPFIECLALYQQDHGRLSYDPQGMLPADTRYHPKDTPERRQQQKDFLLNSLAIPARWFSVGRLPLPNAWPKIDRPGLRYRPTALFDPATGLCISGPRGISYSTSEGLSQ
ncbi:CRISPR-associated helicase Cas3' [Streptomyces hesseae]|uniref:CRISPR-associated helicase Cas3 n=1 Tax=Streptomyces hesseae TaxID=3075519 RepID=A0ABU2SZ68_9ACTN|nr:CRISPR-associated helicase Cas3' [Streptomyces sp. DSM 40473]MDT0453664.1 CRISPR-associated helicase Cas3' [Streptomyces sp. DSM 40473]